MNQPLLSIITCGKNDQYAGNFLQRLQLNLSKLESNLKEFNITDVEILVTDWGSEIPLHTVLDITDFKFTKFICVPPHTAHQYSPDSAFSFTQALNTGYKQSQGSYIFFIDGDSYIPDESFNKLYNLIKDFTLTDNIFYWASRYHLPYEIHSNISNINELDTFILNWKTNKNSWKHDKINLGHFGGAAMGLLLSKNICEESSCWYEKLNKWGWVDIEIHNRISSRYPCCGDLEDLDMYFFHLDHHSIAAGGQNGHNPHKNALNFKANQDNWGLNDELLTII
jgi:predicted glycosyltransferase involved in capsule biosynthesis